MSGRRPNPVCTVLWFPARERRGRGLGTSSVAPPGPHPRNAFLDRETADLSPRRPYTDASRDREAADGGGAVPRREPACHPEESAPSTPYERALAHPQVAPATKQQLREQYRSNTVKFGRRLTPMVKRNSDFLKVLVGQIAEDQNVNI